MSVPHGKPAKDFISWVNFNSLNESQRCRILLAEVLLRLERIENKIPTETQLDKER